MSIDLFLYVAAGEVDINCGRCHSSPRLIKRGIERVNDHVRDFYVNTTLFFKKKLFLNLYAINMVSADASFRAAFEDQPELLSGIRKLAGTSQI